MRAHDFGRGLPRSLAARKRCEGEHKMVDAAPLIFPQLGPIYQALFPWAEALLRRGGAYAHPHGLRSTFWMFPSTGAQSHNLTEFANELDRGGYKCWSREPGWSRESDQRFQTLSKSPTALGTWLRDLLSRAHTNKVVVAPAAKIARIIWALHRNKRVFESPIIMAG